MTNFKFVCAETTPRTRRAEPHNKLVKLDCIQDVDSGLFRQALGQDLRSRQRRRLL